MAIRTYTRFFELCFCSNLCIERETDDRCQVHGIVTRDCYKRKIREETLHPFLTVTTELSQVTKVESEILGM